MLRSSKAWFVFAAAIVFISAPVHAQWDQWGGPNQDFKVKTKGLAMHWPAEGPKKLWSHDIGEGYAGIVVEKGRLYTMCRRGDQEVILALKEDTGEKLWECAYDSPIHPKHVKEFNAGPRGTPVYADGRLYAIGCSGKMHCVNAVTGKIIWKHDLWEEFKGTFLNHGYSSSPFVYKGLVITLVGGEGHGIVAFDAKTGKVAWQKHDFDNSYATPKLIDLDGQEQLVCFMANEVIGINPETGKLYWRFEHSNQYKQNISMPVWGKDHILFISSPGDAGSRGLELTKKGKRTTVKEMWNNPKVSIHHTNAIRIGDYVYTSSGGRGGAGGPGLLYAVNVKTGELAWRERGFAKANCLYADGLLIILDEDGNLGLATATPELLEVRCKAQILGSRSWTVPTLVGHKLFLRDSKNIVALDLGADQNKG